MTKLSVQEQLQILSDFYQQDDKHRKLLERQDERRLCGPFSLHQPSEEEE